MKACTPGRELVAGSRTADDAACVTCTVGTFSTANGTQPCSPHTARVCVAGKEVLVPGTSTTDTKCGAVPKKPPAAPLNNITEAIGSIDTAVNKLNKNRTISTVEATRARADLVGSIADIVNARTRGIGGGTDEAVGNGGAGGGSTPTPEETALESLRGASLGVRTSTMDALVGALANATANSSQIDPDTASVAIMVLYNVTALATAIRVGFSTAATVEIVRTLSSVLDARGGTTPDDNVRSIPAVIDAVVACGQSTLQVTAKNVALSSVRSEAAQLGWAAAFKVEESAASSSLPSALSVVADGRLDLPIQVRLGGAELFKWGGGAVRTTLVQYAAAHNPFWPSMFQSTDAVSVSITPAGSSGNGTAPANDFAARRRRLQSTGTEAMETATCPSAAAARRRRRLVATTAASAKADGVRTMNVTFQVRTQKWEDGSAGTASADNITYTTTDACGKNTTHTANTVVLPGAGDSADSAAAPSKMMWCAWWSEGGWRTEGCSAVDITTTPTTTTTSSATKTGPSNPSNMTAVTCRCLIEVPVEKEGGGDAGYHGDFGIVNYAFNRIAESFTAADVPFVPSLPCILICGIPTLLYLVFVVWAKTCRTDDVRSAIAAEKARKNKTQRSARGGKSMGGGKRQSDSGVGREELDVFDDSARTSSTSFAGGSTDLANIMRGRGASASFGDEGLCEIANPMHTPRSSRRKVLDMAGGKSRTNSAVETSGEIDIVNPMRSPSVDVDAKHGDEVAAGTGGNPHHHQLSITVVGGEGGEGDEGDEFDDDDFEEETPRGASGSILKHLFGKHREPTTTSPGKSISVSADGTPLPGEHQHPLHEHHHVISPTTGHILVYTLFGVRYDGRASKDPELVRTEVGHGLLWWWWRAMKKHHDVLAPFLAPYNPYRSPVYYLTIALAKYIACVASGTLLYHLHLCFNWSSSVVGSNEEGEHAAGGVVMNMVTTSWWAGKFSLVALSLVVQKFPMMFVSSFFNREKRRAVKQDKEKRRQSRREYRSRSAGGSRSGPTSGSRSGSGSRGSPGRIGGDGDGRNSCASAALERARTSFPWGVLFVFMCTFFGVAFVLTSRGYLESSSADETGKPCGCRGIGGEADATEDWLFLVSGIVLFRMFIWRPLYVLSGACFHRRLAMKDLEEADEDAEVDRLWEENVRSHSVDAFTAERKERMKVVIARSRSRRGLPVGVEGGGDAGGSGAGGGAEGGVGGRALNSPIGFQEGLARGVRKLKKTISSTSAASAASVASVASTSTSAAAHNDGRSRGESRGQRPESVRRRPTSTKRLKKRISWNPTTVNEGAVGAAPGEGGMEVEMHELQRVTAHVTAAPMPPMPPTVSDPRKKKNKMPPVAPSSGGNGQMVATDGDESPRNSSICI